MATGPFYPNVYGPNGEPVPVSQGPLVRKTFGQNEGPTTPDPKRAAAQVLALIPKLPPQAGLL